jgi:hypothetical protein
MFLLISRLLHQKISNGIPIFIIRSQTWELSMQPDKIEMIKYSLEKAEQAIASAKINIKSEFLSDAPNRIYYAAFYSVLALGYLDDFVTSKHSQLMGWFNKIGGIGGDSGRFGRAGPYILLYSPPHPKIFQSFKIIFIFQVGLNLIFL